MTPLDDLKLAQDQNEARLRGEVDLMLDKWGGKPGTNWKQVSPEAKKRLKGLIAHYRKMPHPFRACVRDNTKRFGKDGAERVCAVLKDLIEKRTTWRKGGKKKHLSELLEMTDEQFDTEVFTFLESIGPEEVDALAAELDQE
jgi:hypothetical protein